MPLYPGRRRRRHAGRCFRRGSEDLVQPGLQSQRGRVLGVDGERLPGARVGARSSPRSSATRAKPTTAIELRGSGSAAWRYSRSAWSPRPIDSARSACRMRLDHGASRGARDAGASSDGRVARSFSIRSGQSPACRARGGSAEQWPLAGQRSSTRSWPSISSRQRSSGELGGELLRHLAVPQHIQLSGVGWQAAAEVVRLAQREQVVGRIPPDPADESPHRRSVQAGS